MRRLLACGLLLWAGAARATPLLDRHIGGPVFVGPTEAGPASLYWNPAAIGLESGTHFLMLGEANLEWTSIARATISSSDGQPAPGGERSFGTQTPLYLTPGGFLGITSDLGLGTNLTVGMALFLPIAERLPGLDPALGYHGLGGSIYGEATTFAASYRAASWFYAGITFGALFTKLDLQFLRDPALDACGAPPCDVENPARAERWHLSSEWNAVIGLNFDAAWWAGAGFLVHRWDWWMGFSATFPGLFSGDISKTGTLDVTPAGAGAPVRGQARAAFQLPYLLNLGVRHAAFGTFDLVINGSFAASGVQESIDLQTYGSALRAAGIPEWVVRRRGLRNVWSLEAGVEQLPAQLVRFGARARVSNGAVPGAEVAADRVDAPTLELGAGVEVRLTQRLSLTGGGTLALMLPVDVDPGAFSPRAAIDCVGSGYDISLPACAAVRAGLGIPTAAGSYKRVGTQLSFGFALDWW